jgi:hypothetical protein
MSLISSEQTEQRRPVATGSPAPLALPAPQGWVARLTERRRTRQRRQRLLRAVRDFTG